MLKIIYSDGNQYNNIQELHSAMLLAWASTPSENLFQYINEIKKRMIAVIKKKNKINK